MSALWNEVRQEASAHVWDTTYFGRYVGDDREYPCPLTKRWDGYDHWRAPDEGEIFRRAVALLVVGAVLSILQGPLGRQTRWVCKKIIRHRGFWVNEDWGGPESGGMAGYCQLCGDSFHHILY